MMRKVVACCIMVVLGSALFGEEISLDKGGVKFNAPEGFSPLPEQIIKIKFPSARRPKYVIGNQTASTTIAFDIKPNALSQDKVDQMRLAFTQLFPKVIPNLKWITNKTITMNGRKWGYMEMTSSAINADIHNIMLFTDYKGKMLIFNFNSTKKDFKKYEKALKKSLNTIKIKE